MKPEILFNCLADSTRLKITLLTFQEGELCVCELVEAMKESQPKVSRHLALLRSGDILVGTRREQWVYYSINPLLPKWAFIILQQVCEAHANELKKLTQQLWAMKNRPNCC